MALLAGEGKPLSRKRPKAVDLDVAALSSKVQQLGREGKLKILTVPELKCYLKAHNKPVGGKKDQLIDRLLECI